MWHRRQGNRCRHHLTAFLSYTAVMQFTRHRFFSFVSVSLIAMLCSACGQTGPLYLPDRGRESVPAHSDAEAAESESEERENRRGTHDTPATDTHTPVTPPDPARPTQPQPGTP